MESYGIRFMPKEPELVSKLSETKRLVWDVSRNSEIASFGVSVKPKLTTLDAKQM
jgi:hypothetical protein